MELTIREAAVLLGRSPRTVRALAARGQLAARRKGRAWKIDSRRLPLTAEQHAELQSRAATIRTAVEAELPSRATSTRDRRRRSIADLRPFVIGRELFHASRSNQRLDRATQQLATGLLRVSEAAHAFAPQDKVEALLAARREFSRCAGHLLLDADDGDVEARSLATRIEDELLPALAGLLRWAENRTRRDPP